jgi:prolipoprotein diacylglyceryltransferase
MIWEGGIIFYGGAIGAVVAYFIYYLYLYIGRNVRLDSLKIADICAPPLALGLCLGRVGCLLNGCCYGQVACADCAVVPIRFPLSAMCRPPLVGAGYQTAAGFTLADPHDPRDYGVLVGDVDPQSPAYRVAGLRAGDLLVKVNGKELRRETVPVGSAGRQADLSPIQELENLLGRDWKRGDKKLSLEIQDKEPGKPRPLPTFTPYTLGLYPTQAFESVSMLLLFVTALAFYPLRTRNGQVMALVMIGYGAHRWLNEHLRDDFRPGWFETGVSVALIAGGVVLLLALWQLARPVK